MLSGSKLGVQGPLGSRDGFVGVVGLGGLGSAVVERQGFAGILGVPQPWDPKPYKSKPPLNPKLQRPSPRNLISPLSPRPPTRHKNPQEVLEERPRSLTPHIYLGGCQNYSPVLGTRNIRCRIIIRTQKGTLILTTTICCLGSGV